MLRVRTTCLAAVMVSVVAGACTAGSDDSSDLSGDEAKLVAELRDSHGFWEDRDDSEILEDADERCESFEVNGLERELDFMAQVHGTSDGFIAGLGSIAKYRCPEYYDAFLVWFIAQD